MPALQAPLCRAPWIAVLGALSDSPAALLRPLLRPWRTAGQPQTSPDNDTPRQRHVQTESGQNPDRIRTGQEAPPPAARQNLARPDSRQTRTSPGQNFAAGEEAPVRPGFPHGHAQGSARGQPEACQRLAACPPICLAAAASRLQPADLASLPRCLEKIIICRN